MTLDEFKAEYADVYLPDEGPGARGLEFGPGWLGIVAEYCDQLRAYERDHFVEALVWGKEKFGALRLYTRSDITTLTTLQWYWLDRADERARRKSLRTCQECGRPGRLRWGHRAATVCDLHVHDIGGLRAEDGLITDADRQTLHDDGTVMDWPVERGGVYAMSDSDLGLDDGQTMDLPRQIEIEFRPFLSPDLVLDDDDLALADLRKKLLAVDRAIGRYHEVKFQLRQRGYEIAIQHPRSMATINEIKRDAIIAEIKLIMSGEQV